MLSTQRLPEPSKAIAPGEQTPDEEATVLGEQMLHDPRGGPASETSGASTRPR
jgi:hypothetical protein